MTKELSPRKPGLPAKIFRGYLKLLHDKLYYRHLYIEGREKMPADGIPTVAVTQHQNCLNDPLLLGFALSDRKPRFLARANVFKNPIFNWAIRGLGALPAYRMKYDGYASVGKNQQTFQEVAYALRRGETVILYPEAGHQDKRWLGNFMPAYLKMAFNAAEESGFQREVFVMPAAHHYAVYQHAREDAMMMFGDPISLVPFYELYKEQPRVAIREVNAMVRQQIESMMLNITDLEHYEQVDFLRDGVYGEQYALSIGLDPKHLPSKLKADKELVRKLDDATVAEPEKMEAIYDKVRKYAKGIKKLGVREWLFEKNRTGLGGLINRVLMLLLGLPLFIVSIIPTFPMFLIPEIFLKKFIKDQMFRSSVRVGVLLLIAFPLFCIVPVVVMLCCGNWLSALCYLAAYPLMAIYSYHYIIWYTKFVGYNNFIRPKNRDKVEKLRAIREELYIELDNVLANWKENAEKAAAIRAELAAAKAATEAVEPQE
ncbi:MAG: 1-acyl-sn-glycerol-3-phosphate acyltransferase [Tidjanibacter sp.]|nr:1-acyl-sn-glycerol-3-phosphate acyltransferase [Tidjanibacter sp.]